MSAKTQTYYVTTYDPDTELYTPQAGVKSGPYTLFGLRRALRKLQDAGYDTSRHACGGAVRIQRRERRFPASGGVCEDVEGP